jgi:hypothetical protein
LCRVRHNSISTIVITQKWNCLSPIVRCNTVELYIWRLRNYKDIECYLDELSALYPKPVLLELYNEATDTPHSFLYVKLTEPDKKKMFFQNMNKQLVVVD